MLATQERFILVDIDRSKPGPSLVARREQRAPIDPLGAGAPPAARGGGRPGSAAVDVYESEPVLTGDHPLLKRDIVRCTALSPWTDLYPNDLYLGEAFDNLLAFTAGKPVNIVNPGALK